MLRGAIRAVAANGYKNKAISESKRASSKANDAKRKFSYAKREKDIEKKLNYRQSFSVHSRTIIYDIKKSSAKKIFP